VKGVKYLVLTSFPDGQLERIDTFYNALLSFVNVYYIIARITGSVIFLNYGGSNWMEDLK
jgi:hypothetical protein